MGRTESIVRCMEIGQRHEQGERNRRIEGDRKGEWENEGYLEEKIKRQHGRKGGKQEIERD